MAKIFFNTLLLFPFLLSGFVSAQVDDSDSNRFFLVLKGGTGYGVYCDLGASPRQYVGMELTPGFGVDIRKPQWRMAINLNVDAGAYGLTYQFRSFNCLGGQPRLDIQMLWKCLDKSGWQGWVGGGIGDWGDIRYNSLLGNSCVGISNCIYAAVVGRVEYTLKRWNLYGQLSFQPVGMMLRPGFAYVANYDKDIANPVANTFAHYHWYVAGACGLNSEVGAELMLHNGNRIGIAYRWHHVTSRVSPKATGAPWRFDQAAHQLVLSLALAL